MSMPEYLEIGIDVADVTSLKSVENVSEAWFWDLKPKNQVSKINIGILNGK